MLKNVDELLATIEEDCSASGAYWQLEQNWLYGSTSEITCVLGGLLLKNGYTKRQLQALHSMPIVRGDDDKAGRTRDWERVDKARKFLADRYGFTDTQLIAMQVVNDYIYRTEERREALVRVVKSWL